LLVDFSEHLNSDTFAQRERHPDFPQAFTRNRKLSLHAFVRCDAVPERAVLAEVLDTLEPDDVLLLRDPGHRARWRVEEAFMPLKHRQIRRGIVVRFHRRHVQAVRVLQNTQSGSLPTGSSRRKCPFPTDVPVHWFHDGPAPSGCACAVRRRRGSLAESTDVGVCADLQRELR
jgi:hypothetical protein